MIRGKHSDWLTSVEKLFSDACCPREEEVRVCGNIIVLYEVMVQLLQTWLFCSRRFSSLHGRSPSNLGFSFPEKKIIF